MYALYMWIAWLSILATHPFLIFLLLFHSLALVPLLSLCVCFLDRISRRFFYCVCVCQQKGNTHTRVLSDTLVLLTVVVECHQFSAQINVYDERNQTIQIYEIKK